MQAQPRGRKRGPKENINTEEKKSKKEEGEEEPKPFVCAIYRRDVASFLPRAKIQQWRQTSSLSNASLIEFPSELSRFKYYGLSVEFAKDNRCIVQKSGFLEHQTGYFSMAGKEFHSIFKFRFCCRDVRDRASELIGQRLFPNKPDDEGVAFTFLVEGGGPEDEKVVVCRVPNLLTKKTAPAMLHFLHHLSQACYELITIEPGATADAAEGALNPIVLQALPKFQLRGVKFCEFSNLSVKMASVMRVRFNHLFYYYHGLGEDISQMLDIIANGRQMDKSLELGNTLYPFRVDQIVKYFEEDVQSLEEAIRDVRYLDTANERSGDWPERCPKETATQVTERDDGTVEHRFDFTNAHSKEPFSLLLGTRRHEGHTVIVKFHLKFGST